ncbi:DUF4192 domain-containing protein [Streptomyces sp. NPDC029004]|uniref:DUF4192 domain-containing protein n=1 Tax=Streptomyces sp. NPDC029004 TaxID=3154490 RepID=UPI00340F9C04
MNKHHETTGPADEQQITLRGPAELADALPYMMGFHPNDSIVLVALHGNRGRFGGRLRLGIPSSAREWSPVAEQLAECLIEGSERRGSRPDGIVVFLCQDPAEGETSRRVMERLRPLAQRLRTACGTLEVPVYEALCISDGRFWSYCCPDARCCPPEGSALALPGTSVMAAAAAYAGIQVRGSLREMEGRLAPLTTPPAADQEKALDTAGATLVSRILDEQGREQVAAETLALARRLMTRIAESPRSDGWAETDVADDRLITHDEAAAVILGIQDRDTRDRAAEWMEGPDAPGALRLWRALARRCVGPYCEHAAAPLTLAGWVAWSTGDEPAARVALGLALRVDPDYVFARLLHEACNQGLDPETVRSCLRAASSSRAPSGSGGPDEGAGGEGGRGDDGRQKARSRPRPRRLRQPLGKKALPPAGPRPAKSAPADRARGSRRTGERGTRSGR